MHNMVGIRTHIFHIIAEQSHRIKSDDNVCRNFNECNRNAVVSLHAKSLYYYFASREECATVNDASKQIRNFEE